MTALMILILFLINALLIFAIILLFMRQNRLVEVEKKQRALLSEAEELISGLLAEIREENDRFLQQIIHVRELEENPQENTSHTRDTHRHPAEADFSEETFAMPDEQEKVQEEQSLSKQVEAMAAQGMTLTEIAKSLGKGKTEIELAMKFYQQA